MANGIDIQIGASVQGALTGLTAVESRTIQLEKSISRLQSVIANTTSTNQLNSALSALSKRQAELNKIVSATPAALTKTTTSSNQATLALSNLGRVAQDAPFGFIGIANNLNPLLESFQRLKVSTGTIGGALEALGEELTGAGGLGFAISIVSSLAIVFGDRLFSAGKKAKEAKTAADELKDSIDGIFSSVAKEATQVTGFVAILKSETETRQRKLEAIKELQRIQPEVFNNLKLEGDAVIGLDAAYQKYLTNLKTVIAAKIKQAQLEQLIEKQLKQQGVTLTDSQKRLLDNTKKFVDARKNDPALQGGDKAKVVQFYQDQEDASKKAAKSIADDIDGLIKDLTELSAGINTKDITIKPEKVSIDSQLAEIIKLDKPLAISATVDLKDIEIISSADLLKNTDEIQSNISKAMSKLVIAPKFNIDPEVFERNKKIRESMEQMLKDAQFVAGAISNAFGQAFDRIAEGDNVFQAIGEALRQLVLDLIKAAIQALIFRAIMSAVPGGAALSGAGSGLSGFFGGFRASGGPVSGGKAYVVGENGPEIFAPNVNGTVIPNGRISGMSQSGGTSIFGRQRQVVRGSNILLAYARTDRSQRRLGRG